MKRKPFLIALLISVPFFIGYTIYRKIELSNDTYSFSQIKTDSMFNSKQIISLFTLQKKTSEKFHIEFDYSNSELKTTSTFGKVNNAIAAINGGFFDMNKGGSVTYFERNDTVISRNRSTELKWAVPDSLVNGAIVIKKDFNIAIEPANSEQYYEQSNQEAAVLVTGPLLLQNSEILKLPNMAFSNKRHPRTCLCETEESLVFVTIDGRGDEAQGLNLHEVQQFLLDLGCVNAINLDGGGSSTMWLKAEGIVNFPSDSIGERAVANALLLVNNK